MNISLNKLVIGFLLFLSFIGFHHIYYTQSFVCNKEKNSCYSTIFGIKSSDSVKLNELNGITVVASKKANHKSKYHTVMEDVYMPTLVTKQGSKVSFYNSPTKSYQKAQQDATYFTMFLRGNTNKLTLKNMGNFIWLF